MRRLRWATWRTWHFDGADRRLAYVYLIYAGVVTAGGNSALLSLRESPLASSRECSRPRTGPSAAAPCGKLSLAASGNFSIEFLVRGGSLVFLFLSLSPSPRLAQRPRYGLFIFCPFVPVTPSPRTNRQRRRNLDPEIVAGGSSSGLISSRFSDRHFCLSNLKRI